MTKPLFIPLKTEYFEAFKLGAKTHEYRKYNAWWNEKKCQPGRPVILSKGYGKHDRIYGVVKSFKARLVKEIKDQKAVKAIKDLYGHENHLMAIIEVEIQQQEKPND